MRLGEEIQEVLRRGDGELIFNKLAIYSTTKRSVLLGLTSTALWRDEKLGKHGDYLGHTVQTATSRSAACVQGLSHSQDFALLPADSD